MKKILILGGTINQVPLIEHAKNEGYKVILCDWTSDNPGVILSDKHYMISTLDKEAVLDVAIKENVDGIISNSEPAMPIVSFVSEKLGLIGNSVSSCEALISKDKFRVLQEKIGVYAPKHFVVNNLNSFIKKASELIYPIIVKPVESSGSRGICKVEQYDEKELIDIFFDCRKFSRNGEVSIEQYVEMPDLKLLDGDIFVFNDDILWDGLFFSIRSKYAPMVPMTQSFPLVLEPYRMEIIKNTISKILKSAGIIYGEFNIEMYFTKENQLFVIEINPRQGGNSIPFLVEQHCGIDMYKLLVTTCVGDFEYYNFLKNFKRKCNYVSRHPVFSYSDGIYNGIFLSDDVKKYVVKLEETKKYGDIVNKCTNATDVVGFVNLSFENYDIQKEICENLEDKIFVLLK